MQKEYRVIGVMSGTSLDGLDIVLCKIKFENEKYSFELESAETFKYSGDLKEKLSTAQNLSGFELIKFHKSYGKYIGQQIKSFLKEQEKPDFIASHGHTVFHRPDENITLQIGDGAFIAAETGIITISDFRNIDTALKGQGAPLVPIGDKLLFPGYDYCINLGGFANISFDDEKNKRIAFDICPVNILANDFAKETGAEYDLNGELGEKGEINDDLLNELNNIDFYNIKPPKSLGREYAEEVFVPVFDKYKISVQDKLRTLYEHIAIQIVKITTRTGQLKLKILFTGGGTFNKFLMKRLSELSENKIVIPDELIIDYKEAIIFAFLGVLRFEGKVNCLSSVTGALQDNCGGSIYFMKK